MTKPVVFVSKLGTAKGQARSRIWLEGKRLTDAGFKVGTYFGKVLHRNLDTRFVPELTLTLAKPNDVFTEAPGKVSGKGEKPIIDITGEMVRENFGELGTHVEVTFTKGRIVIRPAPLDEK